MGDGASVQSVASAAALGGAFGGISGGATGDSIGEAINNGVKPTVQNSINAQAGITESAVGLLGGAADTAREEHE